MLALDRRRVGNGKRALLRSPVVLFSSPNPFDVGGGGGSPRTDFNCERAKIWLVKYRTRTLNLGRNIPLASLLRATKLLKSLI